MTPEDYHERYSCEDLQGYRGIFEDTLTALTWIINELP